MTENPGYNERLFTGGIRSYIHLARFVWLKKVLGNVSQHKPLRVIELGCYDGRSIDWFPFEPALYDGFDANWERGLDIGRKRFAENVNIRFHQCSTPAEMVPASGGYDIGISLETMEHIPPELVDGYLDVFAVNVKSAIFISVPNEIGIPFLSKFLVKKLVYRDSKDEPYSLAEFFAETMGKTQKIHRNEHKGFDYRAFIRQLDNKFIIHGVMGVPFFWLPPALSFTVGIVAVPRRD
ncbi:MAG TPA: class I SAM-dependent methyltransferase [Leptolinea sp.]